MKYLPFENIRYQTRLDPEEALRRMNEIVEPKRTMRKAGLFGGNHDKPYEGSINGRSFSITRIIMYRNSFLPEITGTIEDDINGSTVRVSMKLNPFVMIFMAIWFGGLGIACIVVLTSLPGAGSFEPTILIPFGMLLFGYVLVTAGFKYESIKSRQYFAQLFEAEIIP